MSGADLWGLKVDPLTVNPVWNGCGPMPGQIILDKDSYDMRSIGIVTYFEFYFYLASPFSVHPQSKGCVSDYTF